MSLVGLPIRALIADDAPLVRDYLVDLLSQDPAIQVAGTARDGLEAVEQFERLRPDVVLMDIHMPGMNGYEATRRIMERHPTPVVMVSAGLSRDEVAMTMEALKAGALTVMAKPGLGQDASSEDPGRQLVEMVKLMAKVNVVGRWPRRERLAPLSPPAAIATRQIRLIAVGASTGGPPVLAEILGRLPGDLGAPVLVAQQIAPGFTAGLAEWLGRATSLSVKVAEPGEAARPGTVYLAPDGFQMGITKEGRIRLTKEPAEEEFSPSASHLFRAAAEACGGSAIGILLTGMGRDGAAGLRRLRDAGGVTIVQDEETCVVFEMPGEAIRLGAAEYVLSPEQISGVIRSLVTHG